MTIHRLARASHPHRAKAVHIPPVDKTTLPGFTPFRVAHVDSYGRPGVYADQTGAFQARLGTHGQPLAVAFTAGLGVDTDGSGPHHGDKTSSKNTSLRVGKHSANADLLPYVALPPGLAKAMGASLGDVVRVTGPNGKTAFALYADNSDNRASRKVGEGSRAVLQDLGYSGTVLDPNKGGLGGGVQFVVFPGSGQTLGTTKGGFPSNAQVQRWGQQLAGERLGES
jgi:hypothetical protein